jgi:uroporphyrinogen III methyltransferase/synthase
MKKTGKVILVGAGPGDPGLLTLKGKAAVEQADCIVYDRLASPEILMFAKADCELIYVGKEDHRHTLPQEQINALLVEKANMYDCVVRLKGGDVYVFGRGGEEGQYLLKHGISFTVVPGISSALAGPACAGIPVTHRGMTSGFHVVTAHSREDELSQIDFSAMTNPDETCIFLMGLKHVAEVADGLMAAGRSADTPAAVISHATTPQQKCCVGTLATIAEKVKREAITSPALIVVGDVVSLRKSLNHSKQPPLFGKNYLVPAIERKGSDRSSLAELLRRQGAAAWEFPIGRIRFCAPEISIEKNSSGSPEISAGNNRYSAPEISSEKFPDWLIFTSRNGVDGLFAWMKEQELDARALYQTKIAVIGEKTAAQLQKYGLLADFIPKEANGAAFAREFVSLLNESDHVWFAGAEGAGKAIPRVLADKCNFKKIIVYRNEEVAANGSHRRELLEKGSEADGIFFTSASAVERFCRDGNFMPPEIYSIGPECTAKLKQLGYEDVRQAKESSYESLVELAIKQQLLV